ncbi:hypothetical protein GIB67_005140 [Kingdonia uniflora]|uniref:MYND-type domain-containing protein n=1 Tax=Kingdonia uniflora TaxID=39325 RepID=A0A7J7LA70_9MAGN|nr:hypothetical protein GIB67_005140 [Kingdonia uniflora]
MEELQSELSLHGLTISTTTDKGEVIISQEPYVYVPNSSPELRCDGCFAEGNLKKCSACQVSWYCGSSCQKSDWKFHQLECKALARLDKGRRKSLTPSIRLMTRLCLRRMLQNERVIPTTATDNYNLVEALVDLLIFEGRLAVVRAVEPMPKGTEVLISYIETAGSTTTRQKTLKEQYLFTCTCPRCIKLGHYEDTQESAILEGYRCKDNGCDGFLLRDSDDKGFECQQCGLVRSKDEIGKIASELKLMADKASTFLTLGKAYPEIHPLLGLQYYTCGKLQWFLGDTDAAVKSLTKAFDILRITHGTNSSFTKDLLIRLDEACAEAGHKLSAATNNSFGKHMKF